MAYTEYYKANNFLNVTKSSTDDCFIKYGRCLVEEYKNYVFAVYKVISWHEDSVRHENTNLLVDVVNDIV